jgi:hypothetical protein
MKKVMHPFVVRCYEIIEDSEGDELFLGPCPAPRASRAVPLPVPLPVPVPLVRAHGRACKRGPDEGRSCGSGLWLGEGASFRGRFTWSVCGRVRARVCMCLCVHPACACAACSAGVCERRPGHGLERGFVPVPAQGRLYVARTGLRPHHAGRLPGARLPYVVCPTRGTAATVAPPAFAPWRSCACCGSCPSARAVPRRVATAWLTCVVVCCAPPPPTHPPTQCAHATTTTTPPPSAQAQHCAPRHQAGQRAGDC